MLPWKWKVPLLLKSICNLYLHPKLSYFILFILDGASTATGVHLWPQLGHWSHERPISFTSASTIFHQVAFGLPLFCLPVGVHVRATLGTCSGGIPSECPSRCNLCVLSSLAMLLKPVTFYRFLFEIM